MRQPIWDQALRDVRRVTAAGRRTECRAYQLWDGFDNYNLSTELWSSVLGSPAYSSSYARYAAPAGLLGQGMYCAAEVQKVFNLNSNQPTLIFGFACKLPTVSSGGYLLLLNDLGTFQCSFGVNASGGFSVWRGYGGSGGTLEASSGPGIFSTAAWHWLDVEITVNGSTGSINVYLDLPAGSAATWSATGLNLETSGNNYANKVYFGDLAGTYGGPYFDDFHCHDTSGSAPNSILGDSRIYTKVPNGAGFETEWTPNGASANYQCVDDAIPDGDTTYVSSDTAGQIDGYAAPTAGFTGTPNGVVRRSYIRKDDASTHTFQNGVRSGSSDALGTAVAVPSSYGWTDSFFADDPNTSSPWTAAGADAAQLIIDETS